MVLEDFEYFSYQDYRLSQDHNLQHMHTSTHTAQYPSCRRAACLAAAGGEGSRHGKEDALLALEEVSHVDRGLGGALVHLHGRQLVPYLAHGTDADKRKHIISLPRYT